MNKICILVQELLPLYKDNVCNENCYDTIKEHLKTCADCNSKLKELDIDITIKKENLKESADIKKLSKKFRIEMLKNIGKGILIAGIILLIIYYFVDIRVF